MNPLQTTLPNFGTTGISFPNFSVVTPQVLWGAFLLIAIVMSGVTLVLYYHWLRYGFGDRMVMLAQIMYTLVSIAGLVVMIGSISYYL